MFGNMGSLTFWNFETLKLGFQEALKPRNQETKTLWNQESLNKKPETKKAQAETKTSKTSTAKKTTKQEPDEVPLEVVKPKEEKADSEKDDKKGSAGQFTLEW